ACWLVAGRVLKEETETHPSLRATLTALIAFALFVLPRLDWGEREHLTLALVLPYILFSINYLRRDRVLQALPLPATLFLGLTAAVGIALKPQFVLLWFAREGLVFRRARRLSNEGTVVAAAGLCYILAVAVLAPEYFSVVGDLGSAYHVY